MREPHDNPANERSNAAPLPRACRLVIWLAGWLVPAGLRAGWAAEWRAEATHAWLFYRGGGSTIPEATSLVLTFCKGAFADALALRTGSGLIYAAARHWLRHPAACLVACALSAAVVIPLMLGAHPSRYLTRRLPYAHAGQLALVTRTGVFIGQKRGTPGMGLAAWKSKTPPGIELADYTWSQGSIAVHGPPAPVLEARVALNFFDLLGVRAALGRTFDTNDICTTERAVVLSREYWKRKFGADPRVTGRRVVLDGRYTSVIGVLPGDFWFLSRNIEVWTLSDASLHRADMWTPLFGVVARVARYTPFAPIEGQLRLLLRRRWIDPAWAGVELTPLSDAVFQLRDPGIGVFVACLLLCLLLAAAQGAQMRFGRARISTAGALKYSLFFVLKASLLLAALFAIYLHFNFAISLSETGSAPFVTILVQTWLLFLGSAAVLWWAYRDQRRRCRLCLARLAMPATIGLLGSSLFEPAVTELLCEKGHGALYVPEARRSSRGDPWWVSLDRSWWEIFSAHK